MKFPADFRCNFICSMGESYVKRIFFSHSFTLRTYANYVKYTIIRLIITYKGCASKDGSSSGALFFHSIRSHYVSLDGWAATNLTKKHLAVAVASLVLFWSTRWKGGGRESLSKIWNWTESSLPETVNFERFANRPVTKSDLRVLQRGQIKISTKQNVVNNLFFHFSKWD